MKIKSKLKLQHLGCRHWVDLQSCLYIYAYIDPYQISAPWKSECEELAAPGALRGWPNALVLEFRIFQEQPSAEVWTNDCCLDKKSRQGVARKLQPQLRAHIPEAIWTLRLCSDQM